MGVCCSSWRSEHGVQPPVALNGDYQSFKVIAKRQYNHNCIILRFALQSADTVLGLPVGQHVMIRHKELSRAYTPISSDADRGFFELLIKVAQFQNS